MNYKVKSAIRSGSFESKFGPMVKYTVELEGEQDAVEIVQKPDSPVPSGEINGTIETTQYGKKFKKEQSFGGGNKGNFTKADPNTMLISYAKDLTVALISKADKSTPKMVMDVLDDFTFHLKGLYESLSGYKTEGKPTAPITHTTVSANNDNEQDDRPPMPTDDEIDIESLPF